MNLKNTYGMKDISNLTLITKDEKYELDYANEVHVQEYLNSNNRKNVLILAFCQLRDDNMPTTNIHDVIVNNNCKKFEDGSNFNRNEKHSGNFSLVYSSYISTCETVSEFVYAFCDGDVKSGYIKKEINEILNRRKQDNLIDVINKLSMTISDNGCKIQEAIEDNKFDKNEEKDLYFDLEKIGNSQLVRCTVYYNGIYRLSGDFNYIAIKIKEIISKDNVIIYGDYHGIGKYLADMLIEQGFTVCDTKYSTSDMRNMKDTENILKVK